LQREQEQQPSQKILDKSQTPNQTVNKYIKSVEISNKKTAYEYRKRLDLFRIFVSKYNDLTLDQLIVTLTQHSHGPKIDVYDLLAEYISFILKERKVQPITLKLLVSAARSYLETYDVEISPRKFRFKVRMPRVIRARKEALQKSDIQSILNACHNIKLKTYVLFLAATGCRASEALSIRLCDIDFTKDPATVFIRGEYTKTGEDRFILLTQELTQQLKLWIDYKYRTRNITHYDKRSNNTYVEKRTPKVNKEILLFSNKYQVDPTVEGLYGDMLLMFQNTTDRLGGKYAEFEHSKKRRKFTLHSMRRWVKTTISDLGHNEYSEYYIGHRGSTYYRVSETEKIKLFKKIEPYLIFLDQSGLERKGADLENRLEMLENEKLTLQKKIHDLPQTLNHDSITTLAETVKILTEKVEAQAEQLQRLAKERKQSE
jgi:integrase